MPTITNFSSNGTVVPVELYTPAVEASSPGCVVIAYGTDGISEPWGTQIRAYSAALAGRGFVVVIPDYFACTGTSAGAAAFERISLYRDIWQRAIADAVNYAKADLGVDATRIGLLGFSLGGHLCVRQRAVATCWSSFSLRSWMDSAMQLDLRGTAKFITVCRT
jgi:dienelactone hydrolase